MKNNVSEPCFSPHLYKFLILFLKYQAVINAYLIFLGSLDKQRNMEGIKNPTRIRCCVQKVTQTCSSVCYRVIARYQKWLVNVGDTVTFK